MYWWGAMFLLIPLLRGGRMWRTWAALACACAAAWVFPYAAAFVVIDLIAAAVILRRPRGVAQKAICAIFALMMLFEIGFLFSNQLNGQLLQYTGIVLGWVQWCLLLSWGLYDRFGDSIRSHRTFGPELARSRVND